MTDSRRYLAGGEHPPMSLKCGSTNDILSLVGAAIKMDHFQPAVDPRKQELLEARFLGARVRQNSGSFVRNQGKRKAKWLEHCYLNIAVNVAASNMSLNKKKSRNSRSILLSVLIIEGSLLIFTCAEKNLFSVYFLSQKDRNFAIVLHGLSWQPFPVAALTAN